MPNASHHRRHETGRGAGDEHAVPAGGGNVDGADVDSHTAHRQQIGHGGEYRLGHGSTTVRHQDLRVTGLAHQG